MSILKVARMGHPVLRTRARPIDPADINSPRIQRLIDDMFETMGEYSGIGLAAPQVHEDVRLFVAGVRSGPIGDLVDAGREMPLMALINPEVTPLTADPEALVDGWEGCLSIPDVRGRVPRMRAVRVRAYDRLGRRLDFRAADLPGRVIQHESDHLDGILFFDRMPTLETLTFMDEYGKYWAKHDDDDEDDEEDK
jgi:peptide deformylase